MRRGKSAFTVKLTCKGCMNEQAVIVRDARNPLHGVQAQCSECGSIDWMIRAPEDEA